VRRLLESLVPSRLGGAFRWLLASTWISALGDGMALAAGPLLVASQSRDPRLVALATLLQQAPYLVFGVFAGALSDRADRRAIVVLVDLARAGMLVVLAATIALGDVSIGLVLVVMFLMGTAEVFSNNAVGTLLPMLVGPNDLAVANARLQGGFVLMGQLAGPPVGAALFAAGMAVPFFAQAVLVGAGASLVLGIVLPDRAEPPPATHIRQDIVDGIRWVVHNAAVRTLVLTIFTFNITFGAAWSVLVLYAQQRLGFGSLGFGLLTTAGAVGGLAGSAAYGAITRHVSLGDLMRIGLIVETFTHLALAINTVQWVAIVIFTVFGAHALIWGTTSITVRQRAVPLGLQGRVNSVNAIGTFGGMVIGAALGGVIAHQWGITGPFWFAFIGSGIFVVLIWPQLSHIAHTDEALR
jgi:MFS family permease